MSRDCGTGGVGVGRATLALVVVLVAIGVAVAPIAGSVAASTHAVQQDDGADAGDFDGADADASSSATTADATAQGTDAPEAGVDVVEYDEYGDDLAALASYEVTGDGADESDGADDSDADADEDDSDLTTVTQQDATTTTETDAQDSPLATDDETHTDVRTAAEDGAREGVRIVQEQGVNVTQRQTQAVVNASVQAAVQHQNATVEQSQDASLDGNASAERAEAAAKGAVQGALLQHQRANVSQLQAGTYGSAVGALSQSQNATVSQVQAASYGAAHGTLAQSQRANVTQIQHAAVGASAGATHADAKPTDGHDGAAGDADAEQTQRVAVEQRQSVNVTQVQEAAQGAAYGALVQRQSVNVTQVQAAAFGAAGGGVEAAHDADAKKVQEASMAAAQGAIVQRQTVAVSQVQAAARGACAGTLVQHQRVTIQQIQQVTFGAAQGAVSQHQTATVTQIQSAATGAASGTIQITQIQQVQITQIQVVHLQQAAAGAASGAARSAAQNQVVDVQQIQAAAAGAGQGSAVQLQQVNVEQIQVIAESAADGALSQHQAASVVQIQAAARGASEGSIALTQRQTVSIEQVQVVTRNAAADTAAIAAEIGVEDEEAISEHARGTAEEGETEPADDEAEATQDLFVSVEDRTLFLANPNDVAVTVTIGVDVDAEQTVTVEPGASTTTELDPGTYGIAAETEDGRSVELAGESTLEVSVGDEFQSLTTTVENQTLTVANPNDERVTVFVRQDGAQVQEFEVPADWEARQVLDPGTYVLSAETEDDRIVPVNGAEESEVVIEGAEPTEAEPTDAVPTDGEYTCDDFDTWEEAQTVYEESDGEHGLDLDDDGIACEELPGAPDDADGDDGNVTAPDGEPTDLNATVENDTVAIENPSEVPVTVTAAPEDGENRTIDVPAGENVSEQLDPGNYTLTGEADEDREVLLNGQESFTVEIAEESEPAEPIDLDATVENQTVAIENPSDADVTVTAAPEDGENRTIDVAAGSTASADLEPGNYTLTAETAADRAVLLNGQESFAAEIAEEPEPAAPIDLDATVENQTVAIENPSDADVTVTAAPEDGENETIDVPAATNVSTELDPGNYTLTGDAEDERPVTLDGQEQLDVEIAAEPGDGEEPGVDRTLEECGVIDEPGEYELTSDVRAQTLAVEEQAQAAEQRDGVCLSVEASDVVLDGNGNAVAGDDTGEGAGVRVFDPARDASADDLTNVTIRDVRVEGWTRGVVLGDPGNASSHGVQADVTNVTAADNDDAGIDVGRTSGSVEDVAATGNGDDGVRVWESSDLRATGLDATGNGDDGVELTLRVSDSEFSDVTAADNEGSGIGMDAEVFDSTFSDLAVRNNGGPGVTLPVDSGGNAVRDAVVEDNGAPGLVATSATGTDDLENVTVRGNGEWQLDATSSARAVNATELFVGDDAEFAFERESVAIDAVERDALPAELPENATVVGDGVEVTQVESVTATLAYDEAASDADVELWRYDPDAQRWTAVEAATVADGSVEAAIEADGVYVPVEVVEVAAEPVDLAATVEDQTVTIENPSEVPVTVTAAPDDGENQTIDVPAGTTASQELDPGNYTLTGEAADERQVLLDGEPSLSIEIVEPAPEPVELSATVEDQTLTIENPSDVGVTVTAAPDVGENQTIEVAAGSTASQDLDPGTYTLTGEVVADDERRVLLNGQTALSIEIVEPAPEPVELSATVEDQTLTIENPSEVPVTVTAAPDDGENRTIDVPAGATASQDLDPGTYTLTGEVVADDERQVLLDGQTALSIEIVEEEPAEEEPAGGGPPEEVPGEGEPGEGGPPDDVPGGGPPADVGPAEEEPTEEETTGAETTEEGTTEGEPTEEETTEGETTEEDDTTTTEEDDTTTTEESDTATTEEAPPDESGTENESA